MDTRSCPYFDKTQVACDRDNPANRARVTLTTQSRPGKCKKCLRQEHEYQELLAIQREQERHKAQDFAEAKDRQRAAELHEKKILEDSLAEWQRIHREQEEKDLEAALRASREEEERKRQQRESLDLEEALARSRRVDFERVGFDPNDYSHGRQRRDHETKYSTNISEWTANVSRETNSSIPSAPPLPTGVVELSATVTKLDRWTISPKQSSGPSQASKSNDPRNAIPPAPPFPSDTCKPARQPIASEPKSTVPATPTLPQRTSEPSRSSPTTEPKLKATDYSLPAYGDQDYDRFMVGGRRQPVHESQKLKEASGLKTAVLPTAPSPHARLGSTIKPADIPTFTHMQEGSTHAPRRASFKAGLRKSSGSRPSNASPVEPNVDDELQAKLLRRRQWEADEEAAAVPSAGSASSAGSVSDNSSAPSSPQVIRANVEHSRHDNQKSTGVISNRADDAEIETATVIAPSRLDEKRRTGWK